MKLLVVLAVTLVSQALASPIINIQINAGGTGEMEGMMGNNGHQMGQGGGMNGMNGMGGGGNQHGGDGGMMGGDGMGDGGNSSHGPQPLPMDDQDRMWMIAVGNDYAAMEYKDSRGYYQGFHYDLVEEVCKAAKINCTTVLEPYSHCISPEYFGGEGVIAKWYDACAGWDKTVWRGHFFQFSHPYLVDKPSKFYQKKGAEGIDPSNIDGLKIGFSAGISSDVDCVTRNFQNVNGVPVAEDLQVFYSSNEEVAMAVANDEVHLGFLNSLVGDQYDDDIESVGDGHICTLTGSSMMSRKDSKFTVEWNKGYEMIRDSGVLKQICRRVSEVHATEGRNFPGCADVDLEKDEM